MSNLTSCAPRGAPAPWLRLTLAALIGLAALGGVALFAYRMALERAPQYRAALERLVRARTGLDVRFNELGLSWGWRGPEAVFRRVELGEPGRSQVLLRASELIVDFDAWRALKSGQLEAGRVTLVAPDIDITRLRARRQRGARSAPWSDTELLARWPTGRLDVEDATVTVPDPAHAGARLRFGVQHATLERAAGSWSAYLQALLPQPLGRAATLALEVSNASPGTASSGTLKLDGRGLQLSGWREILRALAPGAPYLPSAGIGNVRLDATLANGLVASAVADIHADEVSVHGSPQALEDLPVGRVRGVFHLQQLAPGHWQLSTAGAQIGPFHVVELEVGSARSAGRGVRLAGTADGRIEEVMAWLRRSPAEGLALAARSIQARGRVVFHLEDEDLSRPSAARLAIRVAADAVQIAPQLPPLEAVSGTLTFGAGRLLRSTLEARWLGGATTLHLAQRDRGAPALRVQADGRLDARALVAATGIDTGGARVAGRTAWHGELLWNPAGDSWHAVADASFLGIASQLPDPLAKPDGEPAPFHIELTASGGAAVAHVAGENVRGAFELARNAGLWVVRRGTLSFGGAAAHDPLPDGAGAAGRLELTGTLDSLDLPAWLLAWRTLAAAPEALPVRADLKVGELTLAGQRYPGVTLLARTAAGDASGFTLELKSTGLAGDIHWPKEITPDAPLEVHLERIGIEDSGAPLALGPVLAALGPAAEVRADQVLLRGRPLGTLAARIESHANAVLVQPLRLSGGSQDFEATIRCRSSATLCRARFELASRDAAATLRDFGYRADVASQHAVLKGDLQWPRDLPPLDQAWLASLAGTVSLSLAGGAVRTAPDDSGAPFPLLGVPALLGASESEPALEFARLSADYALREGAASTSDLRFDGAAQILLDGRIGLSTRDYDLRAWILQGGARLPQALASFVSSPRVAAAWMALRDLISGAGDSSAELHLGGTWDAPYVRLETNP
jgi:uncharacterized protein YhdP